MSFKVANGTLPAGIADITGLQNALAAKQPLSLEGTKAAMPVANTVPAKTVYFANDENGGTCYRSDGVTATASPAGWAKISAGVLETGGREIGYGEMATTLTQVAVANTDYELVGASAAPTIGSRPVVLVAALPVVTHSVANSSFQLRIFEGSGAWPPTLIGVATKIATSTASEGGGGTGRIRLNPTAGVHTYRVGIRTNAAGTVNAFAGSAATGFPHLQVLEC